MKINGIIAEYNPFHFGHEFLIKESMRISGADKTVIVMSPNFVERGEPAIINKRARAAIAIKNGVDLVLELPVYYALSSAENFAYGAVALLDSLCCVDTLSFGAETADLDLLKKISEIILKINEDNSLKSKLSTLIKNGNSYAKAVSLIIKENIEYDGDLNYVLNSPNNTLAIQYLCALKKLNSRITPIVIKREGASYSEDTISQTGFPSALSIRNLICSSKVFPTKVLYGKMPDEGIKILRDEFEKGRILCKDDFSYFVHYKLVENKDKGFTDFLGVTRELSDKIVKLLPEYTDFSSFIMLLKTREITYSHISRSLINIMLNIKKDEIESLKASGLNKFIRVLGFKSSSKEILKEIKEHSSLPIITKASDYRDFADGRIQKSFEICLFADEVYYAAIQTKNKRSALPDENEFSARIVLI